MKRNLELVQGVTKVIPVVARADDGTRLDLTGLTGSAITWKLARDSGSTPDITLSLASGIALTAPAQGEFTITVSAASLGETIRGNYVHESILTIGSVTYRPLFGEARVDLDID